MDVSLFAPNAMQADIRSSNKKYTLDGTSGSGVHLVKAGASQD